MVLLSEVPRPEDVAFTAEKILAEVRKPHHFDHQDLHVTVSVGIGVYPADGTNAETLLKHADMASSTPRPTAGVTISSSNRI